MKKNKHYFLRIAIIKTMITGFMFLLMPVLASLYHNLIGDESFESYFGYIIGAGIVLIIGNMILLVRSWVLALDKDYRRDYLNDNE